MFYDNISSIAMTKNLDFHNCTKHIELKFHFIREKVEKEEIKLKFYKIEDQLANIFTKPIFLR